MRETSLSTTMTSPRPSSPFFMEVAQFLRLRECRLQSPQKKASLPLLLLATVKEWAALAMFFVSAEACGQPSLGTFWLGFLFRCLGACL